jgi:DNA modification methylase
MEQELSAPKRVHRSAPGAPKPSKSLNPRAMNSYGEFRNLLTELLGFEAELPLANQQAIQEILERFPSEVASLEEITASFFGRINEKLSLNQDSLFLFFRHGAENGVTFNYHQKKQIAWFINRNLKTELLAFLATLNLPSSLIEQLGGYGIGISHNETKEKLLHEIASPTKLRKALSRDVYVDLASSAAASLVWCLIPSPVLMSYFTDEKKFAKSDNFLNDLENAKPALFARERALVISSIDKNDFLNYGALKEKLENSIRFEYKNMSNYGYFALLMDVSSHQNGREWELAGEITLFAERFKLTENDRAYFRRKEIETITRLAIPDLDTEKTKFELASEGFTYRDLFVMHDKLGKVEKLLLVFQKNDRDETLIPCPACRSQNVRGNSYPSLGVKSWECQNSVCPDRSIYNRGKRYSFKSLLNQAAIEEEENLIPISSIKKWRRDVLLTPNDTEIFEMLMRHYSMKGDVVILQNIDQDRVPLIKGRNQIFEKKPSELPDSDSPIETFTSRYIALGSKKMPLNSKRALKRNYEIVHGDSVNILADFEDDVFDAAVTSPPYFNAREYSQWDNLYIYLNEMSRIHSELLRTLKPGALYFFNIFDYFDNDRTIAFSAMGKKRLALSACFIDLFKQIGFEMVGNIVWDKGDIEGKRSFNAGNSSPFYQAPLNCWEHVLVFKKQGRNIPISHLNMVLKIQPVLKMVKGVNTFGHSAPYPIELPLELLKDLPESSFVVDPFGGSGTSARAAMKLSQKALIIEKDSTYAALAEKLCEEFFQDLKI